MTKLSFGQKLLILRKNKKMSQRDLANAIKIAFSSIARYENSQVLPTPEILIKISSIFGVSIDYLLKNEEEFSVVEDKELLKLASLADQLSESEKNRLKNLIKSYLTDQKP